MYIKLSEGFQIFYHLQGHLIFVNLWLATCVGLLDKTIHCNIVVEIFNAGEMGPNILVIFINLTQVNHVNKSLPNLIDLQLHHFSSSQEQQP